MTTTLQVTCPVHQPVGILRHDRDVAGLVLEWDAEVQNGFEPATDLLRTDEAAAFAGYCRSCEKPVTIDGQTLLRNFGTAASVMVPFSDEAQP
jgi:hypothetical protein